MLGWDHMMGGAVYGGGLLSLLILGALVYGAVLLVRNSGDDSGSRTESATHNPSAQRPAALEILETRYAKGEIDKEEFESRRKSWSVAPRSSGTSRVAPQEGGSSS